MPELIILISAVACAGSAIVLYNNHSNAAAAGIAVISFIVFLYGVGQYVERDNIDARSLGFADAADRRAARDAGILDGEKWKSSKSEADARDKLTPQDTVIAARPDAVSPADPPKLLPLPAPTQLDALGVPASTVLISDLMARRTTSRYIEVSGTLVNRNEFPIKNIVVICGDKSFATGDVTATIDKIVPAMSDLQVAGLRMGPVKRELPPTNCHVARFDRAN